MSPRFKGLTWDHPRGFNALDKAGRDSGLISWDKQPLEGFESAPIGTLCAEYDLVVLDHPHLGEALMLGCLQPLEAVFDSADLAQVSLNTIGPCYRSYEMAGQQWALPLDAATQVMALRPERVNQTVGTWAEVADYARKSGQVALSLAGPHAFLSFLSIAASFDDDLDLADGGWLAPDPSRAAFELLAELYAHANKGALKQNPIGILEQMSSGDEISLCPLIYGYVNYSARPSAASIAFQNAPRARDGSRPGSILGGTGIGISTRCEITDDLRAHLMWLMSRPVQSGFIPANDGQPSARHAWSDPSVNATVRNFYASTAETLECAALRPRHNGGIGFQTEASAYLREALNAQANSADVARKLAALFSRSLPTQERATA